MYMKKVTLTLVITIFVLNFLFICGYFQYLLIPQLSEIIETNNEELNQDMIDIIANYERDKDFYQVSEKFAKERSLSIYLEDSHSKVIYNNDAEIWTKGSFYYATTFFQINNDIYLVKIYRPNDKASIPALNHFIFFELIVILVMIFIIFETTNQKFIAPIEKLQKSIKDYKFGIKPKKTDGITEIDIIQNNFVDLVNDLETEKAKQNRIIASISHDIKTPLTAIMGYSDRLLKVKLDDDKKKSYIEKIHNKSLILKDLTDEFDDYLSCNIQDSLKLERISVAQFLKQIKEDYYEDLAEKNIKLIIDAQSGDEMMVVDLAKIKRVFSNIIGNSVRYTEKKGKITIRSKKIDKYIEFTISDNGKGVSEKDINKIFEPLFTSDPSRKIAGLGLSICKEIVETHGGYIYAKNNKEKGLDVVFTIKKS